MAKLIHKGKRKAVKTIAHRAMAGRSASVMKPEYLVLIENFRLMDDTFMSKCLERAPECIADVFRLAQKASQSIQEFRRREARYVQGNGKIQV